MQQINEKEDYLKSEKVLLGFHSTEIDQYFTPNLI